jgi:hypothetical protein
VKENQEMLKAFGADGFKQMQAAKKAAPAARASGASRSEGRGQGRLCLPRGRERERRACSTSRDSRRRDGGGSRRCALAPGRAVARQCGGVLS